MVRFNPDRPDFAPYGFTCVRWAPTPMRRPDRHNEIEINYLESGWLTYWYGGRKIRLEAGQLTAFWAAIPHQITDFGEESDYFVVTIPLAWFLNCKLPDSLVQPLLHGQMIVAPEVTPPWPDGMLLDNWVRDLASGETLQARAAMMEIEARLLRLALTCPEWKAVGTPTVRRRSTLYEGGLSKAEQIACLIAQRYTEPLTVEEIAKSVGLHPNYTMSLFHKVFGTTLVSSLTQHRVSHAQRLLATTDMKVLDVANASGFGSLSRFNEAFRKGCGCSPRDYRQLHLVR